MNRMKRTTIGFLRPKTIITKILGVVAPMSFTSELLSYFEANVAQYLSEIEKHDFQSILNALKDDSIEWRRQFSDCPLVADGSETNKAALIQSMVQYMIWMCKEKKVAAHSPVNEVQAIIWGEALHSKRIEVPIYADVLPKLKEWNVNEIKVFTLSHGTINGQEAYFKHSNNGDISKWISGFIRFNSTAVYDSYYKLPMNTETDKNDILFITNDVEEAKRALLVGMNICIVRRDRKDFKSKEENVYVNNFNDIIFVESKTNRKSSGKIRK